MLDQGLDPGGGLGRGPVEREVGGQVDGLALPDGGRLPAEQADALGAAADDLEAFGQERVLVGVEAVEGWDEYAGKWVTAAFP